MPHKAQLVLRQYNSIHAHHILIDQVLFTVICYQDAIMEETQLTSPRQEKFVHRTVHATPKSKNMLCKDLMQLEVDNLLDLLMMGIYFGGHTKTMELFMTAVKQTFAMEFM